MSGAHIVAAGETLGGIAAKYELALADLVKWNNITNPDVVSVGQKIELSGHEAAPGQGEDIDHIEVGQKLVIPSQGVAR